MLLRDLMVDSSEEGKLALSLSSTQFTVLSSHEQKRCDHLMGETWHDPAFRRSDPPLKYNIYSL